MTNEIATMSGVSKVVGPVHYREPAKDLRVDRLGLDACRDESYHADAWSGPRSAQGRKRVQRSGDRGGAVGSAIRDPMRDQVAATVRLAKAAACSSASEASGRNDQKN